MKPAVTRFAPSPTGSLHVGGARTALYCYLWAKRTKGTFILRIEDTDRARSTDESTRGIVRDLEWLGLSWDEGPEVGGDHGPYFQSQRLELYQQFVSQLLEAQEAYLAWDSPDELRAMRRDAEARKETFRYTRRDPTPEDLALYQGEGRTPVVRFAMPRDDVTLHDSILGPVTVTPDHLDDLVIQKADGFPTYHFAVVVDDHHMRVTQVLRGQEHLTNTHRHYALYTALGWDMPAAGHMPLIFNLQGGKMSKREKARSAREMARRAAQEQGRPDGWDWLADLVDHPVDEVQKFMKKKRDSVTLAEAIASALGEDLPMIDVMDFRTGGYLPEAILNYLALLGWRAREEGEGEGDREFFSLDELIEQFDLSRIKKTAARFDPAKLAWMNGEYLKRQPMERLLTCLSSWMEVVDSPLQSLTRDERIGVFTLYQSRIQTFRDLEAQTHYLFEAPSSYGPDKALRKHFKGDGFERLADARATLADAAEWTSEALEEAIRTLAEERGTSMGQYAQPLRFALTGTPVSPPIFDSLTLLPREEVLQRIDRALVGLPEHNAFSS
jgi:glutamyl/glutaminyl-tRNA synthetase